MMNYTYNLTDLSNQTTFPEIVVQLNNLSNGMLGELLVGMFAVIVGLALLKYGFGRQAAIVGGGITYIVVSIFFMFSGIGTFAITVGSIIIVIAILAAVFVKTD